MKHIKLFESFINEGISSTLNLDEFLSDLALYYEKYSLQLAIQYPEGHKYYEDTIGAPEHEYTMRWGGWDDKTLRSTDSGEVLGFIKDAVKKGHYVINKFSPANKDRAKYFRGCYYNALDYIIKYGEANPEMQLCFGYIIPQSTLDNVSKASKMDPKDYKRQVIETTKHAFILNKGRIIDPTMKFTDEYYIYEVVPKEIWTKFNHKLNDSNFDGREFAKYIDKQVEAYKYPYVQLIKDYLK